MAHASGLQPIARRCPRRRHLPPAPDFHPHRNPADPTASGQPFCRQGSPTRRHGEPIQRLPTGWRTPRSHTGSRRTPAEPERTNYTMNERPPTATSSHEQPRAATSGHERKTGAQSPRSESPSIPCRHRRSQAGSACRGAGEKVGLKTPHRAPQHDATVVSIPRSHRCSAPAESPDTRCLEAQLAQCEQTLWSVGSKGGSETGSEEKP